jgi:glycine cleavage system aminomethyltransferase T
VCAVVFAGERPPPEGAPVLAGSEHVGHLTSSRFSPVLGRGVALGWLRSPDGKPPAEVVAAGRRGVVVERAFYDPEGLRVRA